MLSFEAAVAAFAALNPKRALVRCDIESGIAGVAFGDPKSPTRRPDSVVAEDALYSAADRSWRAEALRSAKHLISCAVGLPALTAWRVGGPGAWAGEPGEWLLVASDKIADKAYRPGVEMPLALAAFKVEEGGLGLAVWRGSRDALAAVIGLPDGWPARRAWRPIKIWIGD
jgi:hypothetical protein